MNEREALGLVGCILVCEAVGAASGLASGAGIGAWYAGLKKPSISPPGWVFGPVWGVLYAMMGVAAWLIWRHHMHTPAGQVALAVFVLQLVLNGLWSPAFFGARSPGLGMLVITLLWAAIVGTIVAFAQVSVAAAWLLAPYLAWVSFAGVLNWMLWRMNR